MCATWTTATIASKAKHNKAVAPKARGFRRRVLRISGCDPVSKNISIYKDTLDWTHRNGKGSIICRFSGHFRDQPACPRGRVNP
jgi:hypothetical protein